MKPIFKIICYSIDSNKLEKKDVTPNDFEREREWGFYYEFNKALRCVKENWTDIYENGYYNLVCIEEAYEGITSCHLQKQYWFKVEYINQNKYNIVFLDEEFLSKDYSFAYQNTLPVES